MWFVSRHGLADEQGDRRVSGSEPATPIQDTLLSARSSRRAPVNRRSRKDRAKTWWDSSGLQADCKRCSFGKQALNDLRAPSPGTTGYGESPSHHAREQVDRVTEELFLRQGYVERHVGTVQSCSFGMDTATNSVLC